MPWFLMVNFVSSENRVHGPHRSPLLYNDSVEEGEICEKKAEQRLM